MALIELRRNRRLVPKQLAGLLNMDQSYLSGLQTGNKGSPPKDLVDRIKVALALTDEEAVALQRAADLSRRKIEIPQIAEPDEYVMMHRLVERIGKLKPAQIRAIHEILNFE